MASELSQNRRIAFSNMLKEYFPELKRYYEKPDNVQMEYPCIIYSRGTKPLKANNYAYTYLVTYSVQLIERENETDNYYNMLNVPGMIYDRTFEKDGLYHHMFTIIY